MTDVNIAELPEKLAEVLEELRQGNTVTIMDGPKEFARMIPGNGLEYAHRPAEWRPLGELELPPLGFKPEFDGVEELLKDRRRR